MNIFITPSIVYPAAIVMAVVILIGPVRGAEKTRERTPEITLEDTTRLGEEGRQEEDKRRKVAVDKAESGNREATRDLCDNETAYWSSGEVSALRSRAEWCERAGKPTLAEELLSEADNIEIGDAVKRGDYAFVVKKVLPKAEDGDPIFQRVAFYLYWFGLGLPEDGEKALHWCNKAAKTEKEAKKISSLIREVTATIGAIAPPNKTELFRKLEAMANKGDGKARWLMYRAYNLRLVSFDMNDVEAKEARKAAAERWRSAAVEANYPEALVRAARRLRWYDSDDPEIHKKYIRYMTQAADQGNTEAMNSLGTYFRPVGYGNQAPFKNYLKATHWYKKAAEAGDPDPDNFYALLRNSINPERNYDEGLKWLMEAAEDNFNFKAKVDLANVYFEGAEVPRNIEQAVQLLEEVVESKYADAFLRVSIPAQYKLGYFYQYNNHEMRDYERAEELYRAILGHTHSGAGKGFLGTETFNSVRSAKYQLATLYAEGHVKHKDKDETTRWLSEAAKAGHELALRWVQFNDAKKSSPGSNELRSIQNKLVRLGYKPGPVDGVFGRKTFDSVRAYQCAKGHKINGQTDHSLRVQIESEIPGRNRTKEALTERLYKAIFQQDVDCLNAALALGADPNARRRGRGPISHTSRLYRDRTIDDELASEIRFQITQILLDAGSKISWLNSNGLSAIHDGDLRLLKLILDNGETPVRRIDGQSLMHWAAHYERPAAMALLVKYGAPPLSKREIAQARITNLPVQGSGIPIARKALHDGAWINGRDERGMTPLGAVVRHAVYEKNQPDLIEFLLQKGADPNARLSVAFQSGEMVVKESLPLNYFLMTNSASMTKRRGKSSNLIHSKKYGTRAMKLLLEHGAKIAGKDDLGTTPLHWAAITDNLEAAKMLLHAGSLVTHRDETGKTPLDYAETAEMIALLQKSVRSESGREVEPRGRVETSRRGQTKPTPTRARRSETSGSGFFVSKLGHIVTNAHVVRNCGSITVGDNAKNQVTVTLVEKNKRNDLALLKISPAKMASAETESLIRKLGIKIVPLASEGLLRSDDVELGESVLVAGFPYGEIFSDTIKVTGGMVSANRGMGDDIGQFQIDAAVQPGNSGGPIYDENGNIVGVVVAQLDRLKVAKAIGSLPENVNFGIKASTVRQFLTASGLPTKWSSRSQTMSTKDIAQIATNQTVMVVCNP